MTINEAIAHAREVEEKYMCNADDMECGKEHKQLADWLEELQQYRAIGTVEGYERAIESSTENYNLYREYKAKVQEYRTIGTVEECRVAVEKQKPKKPSESSCSEKTHYRCPNCGYIPLTVYANGYRLGNKPDFCEKCGKAIDWSDPNDKLV